MGFCRNLCCFYLEGEENSGKVSICSLCLLGDWRGALGWSGDSQGARGSVVWTCKIWNFSGSDVIMHRKPAKSKFKASIPSRDFNRAWFKNRHDCQNSLIPASECGLPYVGRWRWECVSYAILISVITAKRLSWAVKFMLRIHFSKDLTAILLTNLFLSSILLWKRKKKQGKKGI